MDHRWKGHSARDDLLDRHRIGVCRVLAGLINRRVVARMGKPRKSSATSALTGHRTLGNRQLRASAERFQPSANLGHLSRT